MTSPGLLSLEEAQSRLLRLVTPLATERVDVEGSLGRYLAGALQARRTQPAADLSAMDGYAVRPDDMAGPWRVVGESAAGHPYPRNFERGEAVRISTGALLPAGSGAVILQEDLARDGEVIALAGTPPEPPHKHVRRCGMDFKAGEEILASGIRIGPAQAALAMAAGHKHLAVHRLPRIAIVDSGDELAADPECCEAHQIPATNGTMLAALAAPLASEILRLGPVADTVEDLTAALDRAAGCDIIVTTGGASVGDHDLIRPALESWGADIAFWRVAIKPGKPILVATRKQNGRVQVILGLPGNPVSSYVTAYMFLLPLLRAAAGAARVLPIRCKARIAAPLRQNGHRREFLRGTWDGEFVCPNPLQDSGALSSLAASNALIDRLPLAEAAVPGDDVHVFLLEGAGSM
ncbi:molybdopterin molybdotransferase MoeA [Novosphingobium panipatense]|uniref:Molybdopterin molybdenumtransferase n=1 Tax=Novosphingobium panipatense TaxID=428991 RepID=A0ABY1QKG8_9SPHN|nr:molybdopterin molybdotransferase MoeA [Novosphingobium panipatense]SMP74284.1 molybdopterin molybdochelatase [Novosphingobium panipatense]